MVEANDDNDSDDDARNGNDDDAAADGDEQEASVADIVAGVSVLSVSGNADWVSTCMDCLVLLLQHVDFSPVDLLPAPETVLSLLLHEAEISSNDGGIACRGMELLVQRLQPCDPLPMVVLPAPHVTTLRLRQALVLQAEACSRRHASVRFRALVGFTSLYCADAFGHVEHATAQASTVSATVDHREAMFKLVDLVAVVEEEITRWV